MKIDKREGIRFFRTIHPLASCGNTTIMAVAGAVIHCKYAKNSDSDEAENKEGCNGKFHLFIVYPSK